MNIFSTPVPAWWLAICFLFGFFLPIVWGWIHAKGHCVFGVKDERAQEIVLGVVKKYTPLCFLHKIDAGPTHQSVLSGGTVFAWYKNLPDGMPHNVRSFVVRGEYQRRLVAVKLMRKLEDFGNEAEIHQPLEEFPEGTFLLVTSTAFHDCGIAFRPHGLWMFILSIRIAMRKKREGKRNG